MRSDTYIYTIGDPGTGKTYQRCVCYLLEDFLPNSDPDAVHYSNFPIVFDDRFDVDGEKFESKEAASKHAVNLREADDYDGRELEVKRVRGLYSLAREKGFKREFVKRKVQVFPEWVVERCRNSNLKRGEEPYAWWDYFEDEEISLAKAQVAIDEVQYYCGHDSDNRVKKKYMDFLGGGRHTGSTWEFLTQAPAKVAKCIEMHTSIRLRLEKSDSRRDPWFKIPMYDWYQLRYLITRKYNPTSWITEEKKDHRGSRAKWVEVESRFFWFKPAYFGAYDSFSLTEGTGGLKGASADPHCKRFGTTRLMLWFLYRNWFRLFFNYSVGAVVFCFLLFGLANGARDGNFISKVSSLMQPPVRERPKRDSTYSAVKRSKTGKEPEVFEAPVEEKEPTVAEKLHEARTGEKPKSKMNSVLEKENEELRLEIARSSAVVAISNHKVVIRDAGAYAIGEVVKFGAFEGRIIERIDFRHRAVLLDDGIWLRIGEAPNIAKDDGTTFDHSGGRTAGAEGSGSSSRR